MAKVFLSRYDKKAYEFKKWFKGKRTEEEVKQEEIADELGITQEAVSIKTNPKGKATLTYKDLIVFFHKVNATDEEILRMMRL